MTETPTIEFPCPDYPIRVIAASESGLLDEVGEIIQRHDNTFDRSTIAVVASRAGRYSSFRVAILATGEHQLRALHEDLLAHPLVRLVL